MAKVNSAGGEGGACFRISKQASVLSEPHLSSFPRKIFSSLKQTTVASCPDPIASDKYCTHSGSGQKLDKKFIKQLYFHHNLGECFHVPIHVTLLDKYEDVKAYRGMMVTFSPENFLSAGA
jgi:hypothetical protein